MSKDKFSGQGGDFEVDKKSGERRRCGPEPKAEPAGGGARDKDGNRLEQKGRAPEPAVPAPASAPWDAPATATDKKGA